MASDAVPPPVETLVVSPSPTGESVLLDWSQYPTLAQGDIIGFDIYYTASGPFRSVPGEGLTRIRVPAGDGTAVVEGLPAFVDHFFAVTPLC